MPYDYMTPWALEFEYLTLDDVRGEGFTEEMIPDEQALKAIRHISWWINRLTDQWFLPVRLIERVEGRGRSVAGLPNFVPILQMFAVTLGRQDLVLVDLPTIAYDVKNRYVKGLSYSLHFPRTTRFVQLNGVFGWLVDDYVRYETNLSAAIAAGDTLIPVVDVTGFKRGDAILVGDNPPPDSHPRVVRAVDVPNKRLIVNPVTVTLPAGAGVRRYGRIPPGIQRAALLLLKDYSGKIGEEDYECPPWVRHRLNNESTEGYSYGMTPLPKPYGYGETWTTGNPEVDALLGQWSNPCFHIGTLIR